MERTKFTLCRRVTAFCAAIVLTLLFASFAATPAAAQTSVSVPGNAGGCFGNNPGGGNSECVPFVSALTVSGPGTITITYVSGIVHWVIPNGNTAGPDGVSCPTVDCGVSQTPLLEAQGVQPTNGTIEHVAGLIGVFVLQGRVQTAGFQPLDGTKDVAPVGIFPNGLFLVGRTKTITATEAGTLFLGINDWYVIDNGGAFNVTVTYTPS
jgi:hypothetical protein